MKRLLCLLIAAGLAAAGEIEDLVDDLVAKDDYVREQAARALVERGKDAVPALAKALRGPSAVLRREAARILGGMGGEAAPAVAPLVLALADADALVRVEAARSLGTIGPPAREAVAPLVKLLASPDWGERFAAVDALAGIGGASVRPVLGASDEAVRSLAPSVYHALGAKVIPEAFRALDSDDKLVRLAGARMLGAAGPRAGIAVPRLIEALHDPSGAVRRAAATALGGIGREAADAIPGLILLVADAERRATLQAIEALGAIVRDAAIAREEGRENRRTGLGEQLALALDWLLRHQDEDGKWDADGFAGHDPPDDVCNGPGGTGYDVGVTGLALLAFLESGDLAAHRETVERGLRFLVTTQASDGLFDTRGQTTHFAYNHALASLAMCTGRRAFGDPLFADAAQRSLDFIAAARNPEAGWRYKPGDGESDTSVTGWMVAAIHAGERAGLEADAASYRGAVQWIGQVTHPETGRAGYKEVGIEARPTGLVSRFPTERTRAMTAVALRVRLMAGQDPRGEEAMKKGIQQCLDVPPDWNPDTGSIDMYYWYHATRALHDVGGAYWRKWSAPLRKAVAKHQHAKGSGARTGSWDPIGPWGADGGRVYATALMASCIAALDGRLPPERYPAPMDPRLSQAISLLKRALRHEDEEVSKAARRALAGY